MCFSAAASFTASAVLVGAGVVSVKTATKKARLFSITPFLFAIQQAIEGVQWLILHQGGSSLALGYGFVFFAFLLWPVYMPLSHMLMEKDKRRKRYMWVGLGLGVFTTISMLIGLLTLPLEVSVKENHIQYYIALSSPIILSAVYTFAIGISGMLSSYMYVRLFAALVVFFSALSAWLYTNEYVSTWCFFGAILSVLVVLGVREQKKQG